MLNNTGWIIYKLQINFCFVASFRLMVRTRILWICNAYFINDYDNKAGAHLQLQAILQCRNNWVVDGVAYYTLYVC